MSERMHKEIVERIEKLENAKNCQLWGVCENQWFDIEELKEVLRWLIRELKEKGVSGIDKDFFSVLLDKLGGDTASSASHTDDKCESLGHLFIDNKCKYCGLSIMDWKYGIEVKEKESHPPRRCPLPNDSECTMKHLRTCNGCPLREQPPSCNLCGEPMEIRNNGHYFCPRIHKEYYKNPSEDLIKSVQEVWERDYKDDNMPDRGEEKKE